jgi:hypothetical protein
MENNMTGKITAVLAAAAVLASAGVASAQPNSPVAGFGAQPQAPYADSLSNDNRHWVPAAPDTFKESNPYSWAHI